MELSVLNSDLPINTFVVYKIKNIGKRSNLNVLSPFINISESETLELKASFLGRWDMVKYLIAFSNTNGGCILCGVRDDGHIKGIDEDFEKIESMGKSVEDYVRLFVDDKCNNVEPPIVGVKILLERIGPETPIIRIIIPKSEFKHSTKNGDVYKRFSASVRKIETKVTMKVLSDKVDTMEKELEDIRLQQQSRSPLGEQQILDDIVIAKAVLSGAKNKRIIEKDNNRSFLSRWMFD